MNMSGENLRNTTPSPAPPVYTIYPVEFQGNVNYGFQNVRPEDSPPKYEDVISGEYLKSNSSSCNYPSIPTDAPAYQPADRNDHCTCSPIYTAPSEHSFVDSEKARRCISVCSALVVCFVIVLFILRIVLLMAQ